MPIGDKEALIARWRALDEEVRRAGAKLVVVSKYAPDEGVVALLQAGCRAFAESRPQGLRDRARAYPAAEWHQIGPVQRNKAKYVAAYADVWHTAADLAVAAAVAKRRTRPLPVLVQVNLSGAPHRHGVGWEEAEALVEALARLEPLVPCGLMGIAPLGEDARPYFARLRALRDRIFGPKGELSMGMSGDWRVALEEGATIVRVGGAIWGEWEERHKEAA